MSSFDPDYYAVLGIPRSACESDIKKAYHKMALKWHPDKNIGSDQAEAEKKFKEISEAYDVLSDPDKRSHYDRFGKEKPGSLAENSHANGPPQFRHRNPFDVFRDFFGNVQDPFEDFFDSDFGAFHGHGGFNGFGMNSGNVFNVFNSGFQFSMPANSRSTSTSTVTRNGNHIVTRTVVENGTTTVTVEENGVLRSKTVNGVAQAVTYSKDKK